MAPRGAGEQQGRGEHGRAYAAPASGGAYRPAGSVSEAPMGSDGSVRVEGAGKVNAGPLRGQCKASCSRMDALHLGGAPMHDPSSERVVEHSDEAPICPCDMGIRYKGKPVLMAVTINGRTVFPRPNAPCGHSSSESVQSISTVTV